MEIGQTTVDLEPCLTLAEVAALLGLPEATLRRWRVTGEGPIGFRAGRHVRYQVSDVHAWIESQKSKSRESVAA